LIQTGKRLDGLTVADLDEFATACRARQQRTGKGWHHYKSALANTHLVLFRLNILPEPPRTRGPVDFAVRLAGITEPIAAAMIAYLNAKKATCTRKTVSSLATRLTHFGRFLTATDPCLTRLSDLDRRRHIEPHLSALVDAVNTKTDGVITAAERSRRVLGLGNFLSDITEWGRHPDPAAAVPRRHPSPAAAVAAVSARRRRPATHRGLRASDYELAASTLLLQRACGLRIGEVLDLELDCVHEIP
jgi:integrase